MLKKIEMAFAKNMSGIEKACINYENHALEVRDRSKTADLGQPGGGSGDRGPKVHGLSSNVSSVSSASARVCL